MSQDPLDGRTPDQPRVVSEKRAKQGRKGLPILVILVAALALSGLAMGAMYLFTREPSSEVEMHNARQASDAEAFNQPSGDYARQSLPGEPPAQNRDGPGDEAQNRAAPAVP